MSIKNLCPIGEPYDLLQNRYVDTYGPTRKSGWRNPYGNRYLGPTRGPRKAQKHNNWLKSPGMPMNCMLLYIIRKNSIFQTKSNNQIACSDSTPFWSRFGSMSKTVLNGLHIEGATSCYFAINIRYSAKLFDDPPSQLVIEQNFNTLQNTLTLNKMIRLW